MASNRHSGSDVGSLFELELVGIEDDGKRPVVHKLDLHISTKRPVWTRPTSARTRSTKYS